MIWWSLGAFVMAFMVSVLLRPRPTRVQSLQRTPEEIYELPELRNPRALVNEEWKP